MHRSGCVCLFRDVLALDPVSGPNPAHVLPQIDPSQFPTLENTVLGTCFKDKKNCYVSNVFKTPGQSPQRNRKIWDCRIDWRSSMNGS